MLKETAMNRAAVKEWAKVHRQSSNGVHRGASAFLLLLGRSITNLKQLCFNPDFRSGFMMRILHGGDIHQTTPTTGLNRYPDVFSECMRYFGARRNLRILSFGCSTGEEVVTLREYFPDAEIVGAEINKRSLKKCRALKVDDKIAFVHSSADRLKKLGTFDAVFCMAVFQRTPQYISEAGIRDLSKIYPFAKFENQIDFLSDMVKPNGLIIVHFTQYNFEDTRAALKFSAYGDCTQRSYGMVVFDKHSKLIENSIPWHSIFIKK
jgi:hypothetical protein